jgi:hypothetical protein
MDFDTTKYRDGESGILVAASRAFPQARRVTRAVLILHLSVQKSAW